MRDEILNKMIADQRRTEFLESDQLSLGEIILKLEKIIETHPNRNYKEISVKYDFGECYPTSLDSWRGSYVELALNYCDVGHHSTVPNPKMLNVLEFIEMLKDAIGKTFEGYKGGDFLMEENTPVWVSNYGYASFSAVIDIKDEDCEIIIITAYTEY